MQNVTMSFISDPYWIWPMVLGSVLIFLAMFICILYRMAKSSNEEGTTTEKSSLLSPAEQMLISSPDDSSGRSNYSPLLDYKYQKIASKQNSND